MSQKKNEEFNPYKIDKFAKIPPQYKIGFLKFWAAGAAFFFTFSSISSRMDNLDRLFMLWLVLAMAGEFLINRIILWMSNDRSRTERFLPYEFNRKSIIPVLVSLVYAGLLLGIIYVFTETVIMRINFSLDHIFFPDTQGIGPITFGVLYLILDTIWIHVRWFIKGKIRTRKEEIK